MGLGPRGTHVSERFTVWKVNRVDIGLTSRGLTAIVAFFADAVILVCPHLFATAQARHPLFDALFHAGPSCESSVVWGECAICMLYQQHDLSTFGGVVFGLFLGYNK